jgi:hypothetical protein
MTTGPALKKILKEFHSQKRNEITIIRAHKRIYLAGKSGSCL